MLLLMLVMKTVWTETREELNVLFTRAQQAQNDNYKQNIDNIDRNILIETTI